jgi:hypothetical protein
MRRSFDMFARIVRACVSVCARGMCVGERREGSERERQRPRPRETKGGRDTCVREMTCVGWGGHSGAIATDCNPRSGTIPQPPATHLGHTPNGMCARVGGSAFVRACVRACVCPSVPARQAAAQKRTGEKLRLAAKRPLCIPVTHRSSSVRARRLHACAHRCANHRVLVRACTRTHTRVRRERTLNIRTHHLRARAKRSQQTHSTHTHRLNAQHTNTHTHTHTLTHTHTHTHMRTHMHTHAQHKTHTHTATHSTHAINTRTQHIRARARAQCTHITHAHNARPHRTHTPHAQWPCGCHRVARDSRTSIHASAATHPPLTRPLAYLRRTVRIVLMRHVRTALLRRRRRPLGYSM